MFSIKLVFYRWKRGLYQRLFHHFKRKIENKGFLVDMVYNDILHTFAYEEDTYYRLYMQNAPTGYLDLETLWQEVKDDDTPIHEADLIFLYSFIVDYLCEKLLWFRDVKIYIHREDGIRYFDVYWKKHKQKTQNK